ncbi:hypothetical protein HMPREF0262_02550 [Clostridium sp. ATCC 29733]|nr:hypothetical protein HMPREF0262_02550 [Clostridium sp. ATCC 29733]
MGPAGQTGSICQAKKGILRPSPQRGLPGWWHRTAPIAPVAPIAPGGTPFRTVCSPKIAFLSLRRPFVQEGLLPKPVCAPPVKPGRGWGSELKNKNTGRRMIRLPVLFL